jgi:V/A-type H+/Na+-transporting ATPase subunit I
MITAVPMELVSFMVLKEKAQEIASRLVSLGVFHPVDIRSIESKLGNLSLFQVENESAELELLQIKVQEIARKLKLDLRNYFDPDIRDFSHPSAREFTEKLNKDITRVMEEIDSLNHRLSVDEMVLAQVSQYLPFPVRPNSFDSLLYVSTGKMEEKNIAVVEKSLSGVPHVIYPFNKVRSKIYAIFVGLRRDRELLAKVLRDVAWEQTEHPQEADSVTKGGQEKLAVKIRDAKARIIELESRMKLFAKENQEELVKINSAIRVNRSLLEAKRHASITEHTALFSGWVPAENRQALIRQMKIIEGVSYAESRPAEALDIPREEVPVKFKHSALLKPFELLIGAYGIPRYGLIDPTAFVAISFLIMFGAMFGDIGHGLALVLLGAFLANKSRNQIIGQVKALLLYCGASSIVFGFLYGSFFGHEFSPVWFKPIENIAELFKRSIFLGIGLISLGICINIVNSLRDRNYARLFFDKSGLIGGLIYWASIGFIVKYLVSPGTIPAYYSYLIFSGILIIFLYPLTQCVLKKKYSHLVEAFMESIVGIMEIFMGYLANTVSFIRVAAFSLAHVGLFIAVFNLAAIVRSSGRAGGILSVGVFIFGNILVIALEGMVVTIQSVRLNYYEFFSKFFIGGKRVFKPLTV